MISTKEDYSCIIKNQLYYGNSKLASDESKLKEMGIKSIVDLIKYYSKNKQIIHSDYFEVFHIEVEDIPTNGIEWCEEPSKFIDDQITKNKAVYVHCSYGISRSTTLITYYLMTRKKQNLKQTLTEIKEKRKVASPNYGFMKGLSELEQKLFSKTTLSPVEYSLQSIYEVFPSLNKEVINQTYEQIQNDFNQNQEQFNEELQKKIEPVGYYTIDKLFEKYGIKMFRRRINCNFHHPFE